MNAFPYHLKVDAVVMRLNSKAPVLYFHLDNLWPLEVDCWLPVAVFNEYANETSTNPYPCTIDLLKRINACNFT